MKRLDILGIAVLAFSGVAAAQPDPYSAPPPPPPAAPPRSPPPPPRSARSPVCESDYEKWGDMRGFTLQVGAGVEGFTGSLAPRILVGAAWEVLAEIKPTSVLGIEIAYTGAANHFNPSRLVGGNSTLVRNGGHLALTAGLSATRVQPYLLLGVGIQRYALDSIAESNGYQSVTNGYIPVGGGVRAYLPGRFTMDLRGTYNIDFGDTIYSTLNTSTVAGVNTTLTSAGRWRATLSIGYTF